MPRNKPEPTITFETQLVDLVRADNGRVSGVRVKDGHDRERQISAGLVIGADGVHSTVARLVGSECYRTGRHATGVVFSYWSGPEFDGYHWYYNPGVSAGAIPTNDGQTCIFATVPQSRFHETMRHGADAGYRQVLRECSSDLAAVVEQSERVEKYRGFSGEIGFFRQSFGPGLGTRRRCRLLQGSADGPRNHRCVDRRGTARASGGRRHRGRVRRLSECSRPVWRSDTLK